MPTDIDELRESRSKGVAIFTKFRVDKNYNANNIFCFFESEDSKYYNSRIEKYLDIDYTKIKSYSCGCRNEVLKVHRLICIQNNYNGIKVAFFIDRDFDPISFDEDSVIYQTPCYSIENFYTSSNAFGRIINREFYLNNSDNDYNKCIEGYNKAQMNFHEKITCLNTWIYCQRLIEKEGNERLVHLNNFHIAKFFKHIQIDCVELKAEMSPEFIEAQFSEFYPISSDRFSQEGEYLNSLDKQKFFRGKFELEFLRCIILDLRIKHQRGAYFSEQNEIVRIDPNVNPLSTLSEYADTPSCLIQFLLKYKDAS